MAVITDPIADMLTRIRNANTANHQTVDIPASRDEESGRADPARRRLHQRRRGREGRPARHASGSRLKYGPEKEKVITGLRRISRPGLRVYTSKTEIPRVLGGLGLVIMSTSQGHHVGQARRSAKASAVKSWRTCGKCIMSRIGKLPITVPSGVNVDLQERNVKVKGPKGELRSTS